MKLRSAASVALWIVIAVIAVAYADILFFGRGLYFNDLTSYHLPMKQIVRDVIAKGDFPFWNRFFSGGQPLAANPAYEVFYPPQWLLYILPFAWAFQVHIVLHFFLAAVGTFFLLRDFDVKPSAAMFGALAFVFGGPYLSLSTRLPLLFSISWMPVVLLFVRRALIGRTAGAFAAAAATVAMQLIIGEPTVVIQTWAIIAAYAIHAVVSQREKLPLAVRGVVLVLITIGAAAACIAAVQLIPGLDHAHDSVRSRPLPFLIVANWSMPPQRVFELFLPSLFRRIPVATGAPAITTMYPYRIDAFLGEVYVGLLVVVLAISGFLMRVRGWVAAAAGVVISVIAAAGDHTPLLKILFSLYIVRALRYPEKFVLTAAFVLAVFAAIVLDRFLDGDRAVLRTTLTVAAAWVVLSLVLFLTFADSALGTRGYFAFNILRAGIVCGVIAFGRKRRDLVWLAAASVFLVADLWWATRWMVPRMPVSYFTPAPIASKLPPPSRDFRLYNQAAWTWFDNEPISETYFPDATAPSFWWTFRNGALPNLGACYGYELALDNDIDLTSLVATDQFRDALKAARASRVGGAEEPYLRMSNVGVLLKFVPVTDAVKQSIADHPESFTPVEIVRTAATPRYWFAGRIEKVTSAAEFRSAVDRNRADTTVAFSPIESFFPARGQVVRVSEKTNSATIDVKTAGPAFLVMSVTGHKYWKATIDGKAALLVPVNLAFQGIAVPPGSHTIAMRYFNPLLPVGGGISLISIVSLIVFAKLRRGATLFI